MAKSKVGGSRAYIRGRIGADVYSVGKDGKGVRQQVVRSLAEQVSNPRTESQMRGRMIMSTIMQAVASLATIIDHSFDGLATGQPSISEFIRRNYALVKADVAANPEHGYTFGLNKYQEKGVKVGNYVVSAGSAVMPSGVTMASEFVTVNLGTTGFTVGDIRTLLGLSADGYLTAVTIANNGSAYFVRLQVNSALADSVVVSAENVSNVFLTDGNTTVTAQISSDEKKIEIQLTLPSGASGEASGIIVSEKSDGAWIHNNCTLNGADEPSYSASVALPTYPTGAAQFLNGGDL